MLSPEELSDLKVDDLVETGPMFPAMSDHPITFRALECMPNKHGGNSRVKFAMTWLGITIGRIQATVVSGKVSWELLA